MSFNAAALAAPPPEVPVILLAAIGSPNSLSLLLRRSALLCGLAVKTLILSENDGSKDRSSLTFCPNGVNLPFFKESCTLLRSLYPAISICPFLS